jgi:hypothetical protein
MDGKKVVLAIALALAFAGCAGIRANQTHWTEQLLTAAGFQVEPVATADELADFRALKPRKVIQDGRNGGIRYVYADPDVCKCLYVGDEQQYQKYQGLKIQKEISEEQADMIAYRSLWGRWPWF